MRAHLSDRLHTIPYGVPLPERREQPPRLAGVPLRLLFAGRLARYQKRAFDLLGILKALAARGVDVEVTVAGGGPEAAEFRYKASSYIESCQMHLLGCLDNRQLQELMSQQDVFVLPSAFEGLPVSLLEAMAHGLVPVAAHCRSGVDQVIEHGRNGFLIPIGDVEGFADRIAQLAVDPEQMTRMSQAARRTIEEGPFTVDAMVEAYIGLMEKAALQPFSRPMTGMLPPEYLRGWRSWLPRTGFSIRNPLRSELFRTNPFHLLNRLRKRVRFGGQGEGFAQKTSEITIRLVFFDRLPGVEQE